MAFPSSPVDGQTYSQFGRNYTYSTALGVWRTYKSSDFDSAIVDAYNTANSAFLKANSSFTQANASFTQANTLSFVTTFLFMGT